MSSLDPCGILAIKIDYERLADAIAKRLAPVVAQPTEEYWSTKQIATTLGINRKTVYGVVNQKTFPAPHYFTKERRWRRVEVLAWAAKQRTTPERS